MVASLLCWVGRCLVWLRYRVTLTGAEAIAAKGTGGILFLPNHPGLIDPVILRTQLQPRFAPHALADKDQMDKPVIRTLARQIGVITIPDAAAYGDAVRGEVEAAMAECVAALNRGENLLFYPAGRIYRSYLEDLSGKSGVEALLQGAPKARVVLVRTRGVWGSCFSRALGKTPQAGENLLRGLKMLLANFLFFSPRRKVTIELVEPADLPRQAERTALTKYLEAFYNQDALHNTYVPYTIWESGGTRVVPEPQTGGSAADVAAVPAATRTLVIQHLAELTGKKPEDIKPESFLARELNLDSLALLDLALWVQKEFGFSVDDAAAWTVVGDVLLAACGTASGPGTAEMKPVPPAWFKPRTLNEDQEHLLPDGLTIPELFLKQARRTPHEIVFADQAGGARSYRDILTAVLVLKPHLEAMPGAYLGIMLPASSGAGIVTLAAMFAGKIPVMINWTAGARNMKHSLDSLKVTRVLTAKRLVQKLETQIEGLAELKDRFEFMEDLGPRVTLAAKLSAKLRSTLGCHGLGRAKIADTAVVLFTSGSENLPKAVPLTHTNLLTNMRDMGRILQFRRGDRLLGILPPFHSFGINCTTLLPLCSGLPVVYHANPTESGMLARLIATYQVTVLVGTPTFLAGILRVATDEQLKSLRAVVSGAEKCPPQLYETLAKRCPHLVVLEGYGITECSPVVSANREAAPKPGTIGKIMPSLEYAIVSLDTNQPVPAGTSGMLLVRGPSIFGGYLNYEGASPFVDYAGKQWYRTGDLVTSDADGVLTFAGRLKRFVKLGGEMISLPAIEEVISRQYVTAKDADPVLAVESTPDETSPEIVLFTIRDLDRDQVNTAIRAAGLSPLHNIRRIVKVPAIPTLGTGKTDYRTLKTQLRPTPTP